MVLQVKSTDEFKEQLKQSGSQLVVVDFFATWCGPCKMIAPKIDDLSKEYPNVKFLKVDVDELDSLAADYGIQAMPTIIFIKGEKKVGEVVGANLENIKQELNKHK